MKSKYTPIVVSPEVKSALDIYFTDDWTKQFALINHCKAFSDDGIRRRDVYIATAESLHDLEPLDFAKCMILGYTTVDEQVDLPAIQKIHSTTKNATIVSKAAGNEGSKSCTTFYPPFVTDFGE